MSRTADGRLSLSFTQPGEGEATHAASAPDKTATNGTGATAVGPPARELDLTKAIADASARARRRQDAASFLETVGFKDASVIYDAHGSRSVWHVPEFDIRVEHKQKRSVVSGKGMVASADRPVDVHPAGRGIREVADRSP